MASRRAGKRNATMYQKRRVGTAHQGAEPRASASDPVRPPATPRFTRDCRAGSARRNVTWARPRYASRTRLHRVIARAHIHACSVVIHLRKNKVHPSSFRLHPSAGETPAAIPPDRSFRRADQSAPKLFISMNASLTAQVCADCGHGLLGKSGACSKKKDAKRTHRSGLALSKTRFPSKKRTQTNPNQPNTPHAAPYSPSAVGVARPPPAGEGLVVSRALPDNIGFS